jgi:hypothetical protein
MAVSKAATPRRSNLGPAAPKLRTNGQATGAAFAQISGADYNRADNFATAVRSGVREAERRDYEDREAAQNATALRELGFQGRDDDDAF